MHNTTGGALADIGLYYNITGEQVAEQTNRHVLATNTYYKFTCGPVTLDVVFTAPMLMKDVELMSTPINFISYQVTSNDSWRGETSNTFLEKFNEIKPKLETHLQQLEALGPAVKTTADDYAATEEANDAMMRTL